MTVVLPTTTFQNGQPLDPDKLNRALYDTDFPSSFGEHGVYSAPNGGLVKSNLAPSFALQREHVQPGQVIRSRAAGAWTTLDNMSDVTGGTTAASPTRPPKTQALPGCGVRVYAPFDAAAIRWNVSFFWYATRWWGLNTAAEPPTDEAQDITLLLFVDGVRQRGWRRELPVTWFKREATATTPQSNPYSLEAEQCAHWNLSYLQKVADEDNETLTLAAGWHEVYLGFYVKPVDAQFDQDNVEKYDRSGTVSSTTLDLEQRFSVGCRSARVVAYR